VDKKLIVVTGCNGRIGVEVIKRLKESYRIVGLDIVPVKDPVEGMEFIKVNLGNEESIKSVIEQIRMKHGSHIASFIHLAAYSNFNGGEWDMYNKITVKGTEHLLNCLENFDLEQFIYSSTMLVHTSTPIGKPLNENSPLSPPSKSWEMPRSKMLTEKIVQKMGNHIASKPIIRPAGVYDDSCNSIPLSNQIQRIYEKQFSGRVLSGNVQRGTAFLHMADLVDCVALLVEKRHVLTGNKTYLIAEKERLSYDQIQRTIQWLLFGKEQTTYRIPKFAAKLAAWFQNAIPIWGPTFIKPWMINHADDNYECDTSLAQNELGWNPKHCLRDSLPSMVRALKENPVKWYAQHQLLMPNWLKKSLESEVKS